MKLYLGGDVSKGYADWVLIDQSKAVISPNFQLDDTAKGHAYLLDWVKSQFETHLDLELFAAVESTGGYENNWYNSLLGLTEQLNLKVSRVNPLGVMFNGKADLKRNITDAVSARIIAEYLIAHPQKVRYNEVRFWASLNRHWNFVELAKKQRKQAINQMETLLYSVHPSLVQYRKDGLPNWLLEVIIRYPSSKMLAECDAKQLCEIPFVTEKRAALLIEEAKQSIGSANDEAAANLLKVLANQIKTSDRTIKHQMQLIEVNFAHPDIELLTTFKGIATTTAIGLLLKIGDVHRFKDAKALSSFFGLHPKFKQSGDKPGKVKMSKQGDPCMRKILFMIAKVAIQHNPLIMKLYKRKIDEGMKPLAAIGVCMHKILRIVYGMLKHDMPFDGKVDKHNQQRSKTKEQQKKEVMMQTIKNSRRYQEYDSKAPVSKRQAGKREEYKMSQSEKNST